MEHIYKMVADAKDILVLTGAGMSTESGIPDFRSKSGVYQHSTEEMVSRKFFFDKPDMFYNFLEENLYFPEAKPNVGHTLLAKWEKEGKIHHIVTQNIDGLHSKAGNERVIEFHGTVESATCYNDKCKKSYRMKELMERKQQSPDYYKCDCGKSSTKRYIKPDVVLFGDSGKWMTENHFYDIRQMAWKADLILVLGTTLQVFPFSDIVLYRNKKIPLVIVNKGETPFDNDENTYVIKESIGETLQKIDKM